MTTLYSRACLNFLSACFGKSFIFVSVNDRLRSNHVNGVSLVLFFYCRWIGILILFTYHKSRFDCSGIEVLHTYLVGLLVVLALIILSLCAIVYVSAQGRTLWLGCNINVWMDGWHRRKLQ